MEHPVMFTANTDGTIQCSTGDPVYAKDGLITCHRHPFLDDPAFQRAYQRGQRALPDGQQYDLQWRLHIALWAATTASHLYGDFVECGVNYGFVSSAIMDYLNWDRLDKMFYLLDTFAGIDPRSVTDNERLEGIIDKNTQRLQTGFYVNSVDTVRANFAEWGNQHIIVGAVPETLGQVDTSAVAFLHIDMNCATPEAIALQYFWPYLTSGAFVLLDDYAYSGHEQERVAFDAVAANLGVPICALPTGQGLLIKE